MLHHIMMQDRYHPFNWTSVKAELFFALTGINIVESRKSDEGESYLCRFDNTRPWWKKLFAPLSPKRGNGDKVFSLYAWQIHYWITNQLSWLDSEKSQPLIIFPYSQLIYCRKWQWRWPFAKKEYMAPGELLQDFTWQRYRLLQDYMAYYVQTTNQLAMLLEKNADMNQIRALTKEMNAARLDFLYTLFVGVKSTESASSRFSVVNSQLSSLSDVHWQVILFWWSGMMHYLQKHYPHCFKADKSKTSQVLNPLELYVSITATMQHELHLDEEQVNKQTFLLVLEHVERLAKQNEEMERIMKKK